MKRHAVALKMNRKELIAEHKDLVKDLRSENKAKLKAEARKQAKELSEYEAK